MRRKNGIISFENGIAQISFNNRTFKTKDKSVIAMAQRGNIEGAARRYAGKSSTARALRQANKTALKPIYKNPAQAVFQKMFKEKAKNRLKDTKESRQKYISQYKKALKQTEEYVIDQFKEEMEISEITDRLPNDLRSLVDNIIFEEVQKAYAAKGEVDDSDLENINDRITAELDDYIIANSGNLTAEQLSGIADYANLPVSEIAGLEKY